MATKNSPSLKHAKGYVPKGWKTRKKFDVEPMLKSVVDLVADVQRIRCARPDPLHEVSDILERSIPGLGLSDAAFLYERRNEIPEELRKYVLVFTGTVLSGRGGFGRYVTHLFWLDGQWQLDFFNIGSDWRDDYRIAR